ncbi:MAG TPA: hypothetical protein VMY87_06220 [Armatimonadota bacterium]|nr:hypothetical protein [Armatimonadota bacterium]
MGFFTGEAPKLKTIPLTPEQEQAQNYLRRLLSQSRKVDIPTLGVAGMGSAEQQAQTLLEQYLSQAPRGYEAGMAELERTLGGGYDPLASEYWKGFREQSALDEAKSVAGLRRGAQAGGMYYSEPSMRTEGDLRARYGADRSALLGSLYEAERARMQGAVPQIMQYGQEPVNRVGVGMQYGALPRELDQARRDAEYNTLLQKVMLPYTTGAGIAGNLWQMQPTSYMTQGKPSGFSQLMGTAGQIGSMVAPFLGGGLGGAAGAATNQLSGASPSGKYDARYQWGGVGTTPSFR